MRTTLVLALSPGPLDSLDRAAAGDAKSVSKAEVSSLIRKSSATGAKIAEAADLNGALRDDGTTPRPCAERVASLLTFVYELSPAR